MRRLLFALALLPGAAWGAKTPRVLVADFSDVISPVAAEYLEAAVRQAEEGRFEALVIELDTPGGLDPSMREIVKAELAAQVPVIVYVHPAGARAASAGVFIAMAAHVAAMTPGTNIGAAHPILLGGMPGAPEKGKEKEEKDEVMESKLTNDAVAYLQAIAARRGRNADWAALVVSKSTSVPSAEAVRQGVVDLEADSLPALLSAVDGRKLADFKAPLRTKGAEVSKFEMTKRQRVLAAVSDPNIAMILMTLGVTGLMIELYSPGLILPGIVGAVSLILAFYSFQTLSAGYAGLLFIALGLILFLLELKVHALGLLALSGLAVVLFGGMMLMQGGAGQLGLSWTTILGTAGTMLAVLGVLLYIARQALGRKSKTGMEGIVGGTAVAVDALDPRGTVRLHGELWHAESLEGDIPAGAEVVVEETDGLTLRVRRKR